ncbi:hypothetical protein [Blastococcus sp. DSM 46786]|uniref:phosphotriesterase family protein n=1 Tax=Blastococcus sp. DSM 46786 TaxID=1798227 RepID=UPI00244EAA7D|nr:hypothetical protein [Blastococcus sp. DSM 46786]
MAGTGVKAGIPTCAIDRQGMIRGVERVLRAVAKAHLRTGVPITLHTHPTAATRPAASPCAWPADSTTSAWAEPTPCCSCRI